MNSCRATGALVLPILLILMLSIAVGGAEAADNANDGNTHDTRDGADGSGAGGGPQGGGGCDENQSGSPVILKSGEFFWGELDVELPGRPRIALTRYFRSHDAREGLFGRGWSTSCERALVRVVDYRRIERGGQEVAEPFVAYVYRLTNGRRYTFEQQPDGDFSAPVGLPGRSLEVRSSGEVAVRRIDGWTELYGPRGRLVAELDPSDGRIDYERDEDGALVRVGDENGRALELGYDSTGHVVRVGDHTGRVWRYTYGADGTLESVTDPAGGTRSYEYTTIERAADDHEYAAITRVIDGSGRTVTEVTYDENGRVASYSEGENVYTYSMRREFIEKRDSANARWSWVLDDEGHKTETWPPSNVGEPAFVDYDVDGHAVRHVDLLGTEYAFERNARGQVTALESAGGRVSFEYDASSARPRSVTSAGGRTMRAEYDDRGNPIRVTDDEGRVMELRWSVDGDLLGATDALGQAFAREVDAAGRLVRFTDRSGAVTALERDTLGRVVAATNAIGERVGFTYDSMGRVLSYTDAGNLTTTYTYDEAGRPLSVTDASGALTRFDYDDHGRPATITRPGGGIVTYEWNVNNTLATVTDPRGERASFRYDASGLTTGVSARGVSDTYTYDPRGRMIGARNSAARVEFAYDAYGRRISETRADDSMTFLSGADGELLERGVLGDTERYTYDGLGRVASATFGDRVHVLERDALGQLIGHTRPNGVRERYSRDPRGAIVQHDDGVGGVTDYGYDALGQLVSSSGPDGVPRSYAHDPSHRLVQHDALRSERYELDPLGNRTDRGERYGPFNVLLEDANYVYTNDAAGYRETRTDKLSGDVTRYEHDGLGRLVRVVSEVDGRSSTLVTYRYDALGRRVEKRVGGALTRYHWSGDELVAESLDGTVVRRYRYAGTPTAIEFSDPNGIYQVHADRLGTAYALSDESGQVVWSRQLGPYGDAVVNADVDGDGIEIAFNQMFPGQFLEEATGLHYNRFRDYDPLAGRYIQPDPLGIGGGPNAFVYAGANAVMLIDPYGTCSRNCRTVLMFHPAGWVYLHYTRNDLNQGTTFEQAQNTWTRLTPEESIFHTMGPGNEDNIKFVSPDGHSEAIFRPDGTLVTDPAVYGTYNYAGPRDAYGIPHGAVDVLPYFVYGNSPGDLFNPDRFIALGDLAGGAVGDLYDMLFGEDEVERGDNDDGDSERGADGGTQDGLGGIPGGPDGLGGLGGMDEYACH